LAGHFLQLSRGGQRPGRIVKQRMIHTLIGVLAANTEADGFPDIIHNPNDIGPDFASGRVGEHGLVSARDIVTDARRTDCIGVSDNPPIGTA
jgi:hypothetical protein